VATRRPPAQVSSTRADDRSVAHGWAAREDRDVRTTTFPVRLPLFDTTTVALERALSGASLRQQALTENLANANVPGYRRQDVDFHGTLQAALAGGRQALERTTFAAQTDASAMRADGGGVDVDREATLLAQNGLTYEALTAVVKGRQNILRTAIGN